VPDRGRQAGRQRQIQLFSKLIRLSERQGKLPLQCGGVGIKMRDDQANRLVCHFSAEQLTIFLATESILQIHQK